MLPISKLTTRAPLILTLLAVLALAATGRAQEENTRPRLTKPTTHMVPMKDGVKLSTDVFLPGEGKFPVILARSPYGKPASNALAPNVLRNGYAFVSQDIRGRFKSEGHHFPIFHNDGWVKNTDGHDTMKWIAAQPWCDGNICTWGGSALGVTQNMAAVSAPDSLKAQFVVVAFSNMYTQAAYQGGVFRKSLMQGWLTSTGMLEKNLDAFVANPMYSDFWRERNPEEQAHRVNAPGVFQGGWYDIFLQGTINSFTTIHNNGGPGAKGKCRLVIQPIGHGPVTELKYPKNSTRLPKSADMFRWFNHVVKGEDTGVGDEKAVHYYVMGDPEAEGAPGNFWRQADNWPPPADVTPFYFHTDGQLRREERPTETGSQSYQYDPKNSVPTVGGHNLLIPLGPKDQRKIEDRPDVLLFTTDVLEEPVEVTGRLSAKLYISSDCPDTDFTVKLTDVYPDGRSMLVTDGIIRARYHKSFETEDLLKPGNVYELNVDLWSTSLIFNKGHRIRIAVSSSNSPRFEPNPNTGRPFRADNETRIATNTIYMSEKHASHVLLPIYSGD